MSDAFREAFDVGLDDLFAKLIVEGWSSRTAPTLTPSHDAEWPRDDGPEPGTPDAPEPTAPEPEPDHGIDR